MGQEKGVTELDAVWRTLKPWGKYQCFQLFLILLDFIPASFAILSAVFTGKLTSIFNIFALIIFYFAMLFSME
jgi:hypothetical protein